MPRRPTYEQQEQALRRRLSTLSQVEEALRSLRASTFQEKSLLMEVMPGSLMTEEFVRALHEGESWTALTRHWLLNPELTAETARLSFRVVAQGLCRDFRPDQVGEVIWHLREMERIGGAQPEALDPLVEALLQKRPGESERAIPPLRLGGLLLELASLRRRQATRLLRRAEERQGAVLQGAVANSSGERALLNYMREPRVSAKFLQKAVDFSPLYRHYEELLQIPRIREEPELLALLRREANTEQLVRMTTLLQGEELGKTLRTLIPRNPTRAAEAIRHLRPEQRIPQETLLWLLAQEEGEVRLAAMLAAQRQAEPTPEKPAPKPSGSRSTATR